MEENFDEIALKILKETFGEEINENNDLFIKVYKLGIINGNNNYIL